MPDSKRGLSELFVAAAWFGLLAGFVEASVFTVIRLVPGWITWKMLQRNVSFDFLWLAPLVNLGGFLAIAAASALLLVANSIPKLRDWMPRRSEVLIFAWLACYVAFQVPDRIDRRAVVVLSLGLAVQIWRWFRDTPDGRQALMRRSLPWMVGALALIAVLVRGGPTIAEATRLRALSPAPPESPNVLLLLLDTVRADHLGAYGHTRPTSPNIDRLAQNGVVFERAIASSSWTLPTHATIFTGRAVHEHLADTEHPVLDSTYPTLAESMQRSGFATVGVSANTSWVTTNSGLARGFLHFEDYFHSLSDVLFRTVLGREQVARILRRLGYQGKPEKQAREVTDAFLSWIDATGPRPFFAFLNYYDAHEPYISPAEYQTMFMSESQRSRQDLAMIGALSLLSSDVPPAKQAIVEAAYDGAIAYIDSEIGRLRDELQRRGLLERTVVIVVADHGESLNDHGFYGHGHSIYIDQIHVPLIIHFPAKVPTGRRVSQPVAVADLPATIVSLAAASAPDQFPGRSLARFWAEDVAAASPSSELILSEVGRHTGPPPAWPVTAGWVRSVLSGGWHFMERQDGRLELYELEGDPRELVDLSNTADGRPRAAALGAKLRELIPSLRAATTPAGRN